MLNVSNACVCGKTSAEFCKLLHLKTVCCCEMGEGWNGVASEAHQPSKWPYTTTIYNHQIASSIPVPQKHFQTSSSFEQTKRDFLIKSIMQTYRFVCNAAISGCLPQLLVHTVGFIKSDPLLWINSPSIQIISSCFPSSVSICTINKGSLSGRASLLIQLTLDTRAPPPAEKHSQRSAASPGTSGR